MRALPDTRRESDISEKRPPLSLHGVLGHRLAAAVCNNCLPVGKPITPPSQPVLSLFPAEVATLPRNKSAQPQLFPDKEYLDALLTTGEINPIHLERIREVLEKIENAIPTNGRVESAPASLIHELRHLLLPFAGEVIHKLRAPYGDKEAHHLIKRSIVSWAKLIIFTVEKGPKHLFSEISLSSSESLGRIDGFEVVSINDTAPTEEQQQILQHLARQRYPDLATALRTITRYFGTNKIKFTIWDWKFENGDSPCPDEPLKLSQVKRGVRKHIKQMKRYLAVAHYESYPHTKIPRKKGGRGVWFSGSAAERAELVYCMVDQEPTVRTVTCDVRRKRRGVYEELQATQHSPEVVERARIRALSSYVVGKLKKILKPAPDRPAAYHEPTLTF